MQTYSPDKIRPSFLGVPITGFADGTFIEVEYAENAYELYVGADGEPARARVLNENATVKITLKQTSPVNDLLSAIARRDRTLGTGVGAFFLKDLLGTTVVSSGEAYIEKMANITFGKEIEGREWTFRLGRADILVGGNA